MQISSLIGDLGILLILYLPGFGNLDALPLATPQWYKEPAGTTEKVKKQM